MGLEIELAGPVGVRGAEGESLGRLARVALAYLVTERRRPVTRDELAEALWGEQLPRSWDSALRSVLAKVRGYLVAAGLEAPLVHRAGAYQLHLPADVVVDVEAAADDVEVARQRLRSGALTEARALAGRAAAVTARPFLPDAASPWAERRQAEVREVRLRALEALSEAATGDGDPERALAAAEEVVGSEPFRESGHVCLMAAHAGAGNRAEALRAYSRCRQLLADEQLGVEPSPATEAAYRRLLGDEPAGTDSVVYLCARMVEGEATEAGRRAHFRLVRDACRDAPIRNLVTSLLVTFPTISEAAQAAVAVQRLAARRRLGVAVGLDSGVAVRNEEDLSGAAVAGSASLAARGRAGTVLGSEEVRRQLGPDRFRPEADGWALEYELSPVPFPPALGTGRGAFVGRRPELDLMLAAFEATADGARVVLVAGEPGIGKSRLAFELARRVHGDGGVVVAGRGDPEALLPFHPLIEAVKPWVAAASPADLRRALGGNAMALARFLPEPVPGLAGLPGVAGLAPGLGADADAERHRTFEAVAGLVRASAPLVLVLDDAHWADRATLSLLRHVVRAVKDCPLLLVFTYRDGEVDPPLEAVLADLRREVPVDTIHLTGLAEPAVAEMVKAWSGQEAPPPLVHALATQTEGNPLFVGEMLRHLAESGGVSLATGLAGPTALSLAGIPEGVMVVIGRRLSRLPERLRAALTVAAVAGREFRLDVVARAVDCSEATLAEDLEGAVRARLVVEVPGEADRYRFAHALVRDVLYEQLSRARRIRLHARIADAWAAADPTALAELAHHYWEAGTAANPQATSAAYEGAASQAFARLAYEEAVPLFERALGLGAAADQCRLLLALAHAEQAAGDTKAARGHFAQASQRATRPEERAQAALGYGGTWVSRVGTGDEKAASLLEEALADLGDGDSHLRVEALSRLALEYFSLDRDRETQAVAAEAVAVARRLPDPHAVVPALSASMMAGIGSPDVLGRLAMAEEMKTLAVEAGNGRGAMWARIWVVATKVQLGWISELAVELDDFAAAAAALREPSWHWYELQWQTMLALLHGDYARAEELIPETLSVGQKSHGTAAVDTFLMQLTSLRRQQGRLDEFAPLVNAYEPRGRMREIGTYCLRALYRLDAGDQEGARADLARSMPLEGWVPTPFHAWAAPLLAEVASALGDRARAAILFDYLEPFRGLSVILGGYAAVCAGPVDWYLAQLAGALGQPAVALTYLESATTWATRVEAPFWLTRGEARG